MKPGKTTGFRQHTKNTLAALLIAATAAVITGCEHNKDNKDCVGTERTPLDSMAAGAAVGSIMGTTMGAFAYLTIEHERMSKDCDPTEDRQ